MEALFTAAAPALLGGAAETGASILAEAAMAPATGALAAPATASTIGSLGAGALGAGASLVPGLGSLVQGGQAFGDLMKNGGGDFKDLFKTGLTLGNAIKGLEGTPNATPVVLPTQPAPQHLQAQPAAPAPSTSYTPTANYTLQQMLGRR